jgi:hypothetical protein
MRTLKKLFQWLAVLSLMAACDKVDEFGVNPFDPSNTIDFEAIQGQWTVVNAIYYTEDESDDLTNYFENFNVNFQHAKATCCINGCENWVSNGSWQDNCTTFELQGSKNCLAFSIQHFNDGDTPTMTAFIKKERPGFSFLPDDRSVGDYIVTLIKM